MDGLGTFPRKPLVEMEKCNNQARGKHIQHSDIVMETGNFHI